MKRWQRRRTHLERSGPEASRQSVMGRRPTLESLRSGARSAATDGLGVAGERKGSASGGQSADTPELDPIAEKTAVDAAAAPPGR